MANSNLTFIFINVHKVIVQSTDTLSCTKLYTCFKLCGLLHSSYFYCVTHTALSVIFGSDFQINSTAIFHSE